MQALTDTQLLKHNSNTLEVVRREFGLHRPGQMDECIDRLDEWIKAQPHFNKKDYSREYLEGFIINSKGSADKAKEFIEKLCAYKTFSPQYFAYDVRPIDMTGLENIQFCAMPRLTRDNLRVMFLRNCTQKDYTHKIILDFLVKMHFMMEYMAKHNYSLGYRLVLDYRKTDLKYLLTALKYSDTRHGFIPFFKGYASRLKSIHVVTTSKIANIFVTTVGKIINPKMLGRVFVHTKFEDVFEHIEKDLLPSDYGGKEKPLKEICDDWDETLSTDDFMAYTKDMFQATLEKRGSKRLDKFNNLFLGMRGTIRTLTID